MMSNLTVYSNNLILYLIFLLIVFGTKISLYVSCSNVLFEGRGPAFLGVRILGIGIHVYI